MVKCPLCGSTAQVKLNSTYHFSGVRTAGLNEHYKCGCGCVFVRSYQLFHIEIIRVEENEK